MSSLDFGSAISGIPPSFSLRLRVFQFLRSFWDLSAWGTFLRAIRIASTGPLALSIALSLCNLATAGLGAWTTVKIHPHTVQSSQLPSDVNGRNAQLLPSVGKSALLLCRWVKNQSIRRSAKREQSRGSEVSPRDHIQSSQLLADANSGNTQFPSKSYGCSSSAHRHKSFTGVLRRPTVDNLRKLISEAKHGIL